MIIIITHSYQDKTRVLTYHERERESEQHLVIGTDTNRKRRKNTRK